MPSTLAGRGKRHGHDRISVAVLEDENHTTHGSLSQNDEIRTQLLDFSALPALRPQEAPHQEHCALVAHLGSKTSVQSRDQFMKTLGN